MAQAPSASARLAGSAPVVTIVEETTSNTEVRLVSRPGELAMAHLELANSPMPEPGDGQILVRNRWLSVDNYVRGRMDDIPEPAYTPFQLGMPLDGGAIGEVIESRSPAVPAGASVLHFLGWREYAVVDADAALVVDTDLAPPQAYLGVLGIPGLAAYAALTEVARIEAGEIVFISAAAGPIGSVAGQIARELGASTVIGAAGGPTDVLTVLDHYGFDMVLDHDLGAVGQQLNRIAPDGIDVYLDSVGGQLLESAIDALRPGGRAVLVRAASMCNAHHPVPGPSNLLKVIDKQLTVRGMRVASYLDMFPEYVRRAVKWFADDVPLGNEPVVEGIEHGVAALVGLVRGARPGKIVVHLP
ncbi:MDR family NADP-dependent oxidoreductase [Phytoactinopolyspora limicola]|uniref:MDR family NADP-dependent oxidoreductase n=1 Tax=Phytoactinopolyspora limicola TaxID=2715536 RepID=UPI00140BD685|nr:NADP-dependent oxidoreductase [Phytoactinopolyspora limicola]